MQKVFALIADLFMLSSKALSRFIPIVAALLFAADLLVQPFQFFQRILERFWVFDLVPIAQDGKVFQSQINADSGLLRNRRFLRNRSRRFHQNRHKILSGRHSSQRDGLELAFKQSVQFGFHMAGPSANTANRPHPTRKTLPVS